VIVGLAAGIILQRFFEVFTLQLRRCVARKHFQLKYSSTYVRHNNIMQQHLNCHNLETIEVEVGRA
jgi:hypothetical protein